MASCAVPPVDSPSRLGLARLPLPGALVHVSKTFNQAVKFAAPARENGIVRAAFLIAARLS